MKRFLHYCHNFRTVFFLMHKTATFSSQSSSSPGPLRANLWLDDSFFIFNSWYLSFFTLPAGCISGHRGHVIVADEADEALQINRKLDGLLEIAGGVQCIYIYTYIISINKTMHVFHTLSVINLLEWANGHQQCSKCSHPDLMHQMAEK